MPATRRNPTKSSGPAARGAQSRLTFGSHSKITKPTLPTQAKKKDPALIETLTRTPSPECAPTAKVEEAVQVQAKEEVVKLHKTKEEEDAARVSDAQVKIYWKAVEDERKAPRGS
jgi:DNA polymerase delta subunit 4